MEFFCINTLLKVESVLILFVMCLLFWFETRLSPSLYRKVIRGITGLMLIFATSIFMAGMELDLSINSVYYHGMLVSRAVEGAAVLLVGSLAAQHLSRLPNN